MRVHKSHFENTGTPGMKILVKWYHRNLITSFLLILNHKTRSLSVENQRRMTYGYIFPSTFHGIPVICLFWGLLTAGRNPLLPCSRLFTVCKCQGHSFGFESASCLIAARCTRARLNTNTVFPGIGTPIIKLRWSLDHLIFMMGIPILVRRHLYTETPSEGTYGVWISWPSR